MALASEHTQQIAESRGCKQMEKLTRHDGIPASSQDLPSPTLPRLSCNVIVEECAVET